MLAWLAKVRAGLLGEFFLEDIDGNMVITTDEMRVRLTYEAYNYTHPGFSKPPAIEDVERYIAEKTNAGLRNDLASIRGPCTACRVRGGSGSIT